MNISDSLPPAIKPPYFYQKLMQTVCYVKGARLGFHAFHTKYEDEGGDLRAGYYYKKGCDFPHSLRGLH